LTKSASLPHHASMAANKNRSNTSPLLDRSWGQPFVARSESYLPALPKNSPSTRSLAVKLFFLRVFSVLQGASKSFFSQIFIEIKFFSTSPRLRGTTGFSVFSPCLSASVVGFASSSRRSRPVPDANQVAPNGSQVVPEGVGVVPKGVGVVPKGLRVVPKKARVVPDFVVRNKQPQCFQQFV
jgi:hypothetical protein